jgi:hypothetical protein
MSPRKAVVWAEVVNDLAAALQVAIGYAVSIRQQARTTADDAVLLEGSIARAVSGLKRLQPTARRRARG